MTTSVAPEPGEAIAIAVELSDDELRVSLADGRRVEVPLAWFPRLLAGNADERADWRLIAGGRGIHWEILDEDLSIRGLLLGGRAPA